MAENFIYGPDYSYLKYISNRMNDPFRRMYDFGKEYLLTVCPLDLKKGDRILDIGCCIGQFEHNIRMFNFKAYGIDINYSAVRKGKEIFSSQHTNLSVADGTILPFKNQSFKTVVTFDVLEHMSNLASLEQVFSEMERVITGDRMFHKITTTEDKINIDIDLSHKIKWPESKWKEFFENHGWRVVGTIDKKIPLIHKILYGNFLLERKKMIL
jgi:2-polyprenyl-3-methyl-5-hydroxy-6-metoxy-1,4-benzoquinol methylase